MTDIVFERYDPFQEFDKVKEIWTTLLKRCPHAYYLSWPWRELWIKTLPQKTGLCLITGYKKDQPVIGFFLGQKTKTRSKFVKFHEVSLNSTLDLYYDLLWIEYNSILVDPDVTISLEYILENLPVKWDDFHMPRFAPIYNRSLDMKLGDSYDVQTTELKAYNVDLDEVRSNNDYLSLITPKKRYQIRRSLKEYEKMGEVKMTVAQDVDEALKIYDELIDLHQKRWTERGQSGTFSNPYYTDFHKRLISARFAHGEIEMVRVSAGKQLLGCLYCFLFEGKVYGYLCGFNFLDSHLYSPGLICHYFAVIHNTGLGLHCYDFLEGDYTYKKSLATGHNVMRHILIRRKSLKYKIWRTIYSLLGALRKKARNRFLQDN